MKSSCQIYTHTSNPVALGTLPALDKLDSRFGEGLAPQLHCQKKPTVKRQ